MAKPEVCRPRQAVEKTTVAVLGASSKPDRYSFKAVRLLAQKGYDVAPVNPREEFVLGHRCYASLRDVDRPIDTMTVYLNAERSTRLKDDILAVRPKRVILNPGAENDELETLCRKNGIRVLRACTLVLLRTGQFEAAQGEL